MIIVLDTETTGFSPHTDRIIELAIVRYEDNVVLFHSLINPGMAIPEGITQITGISNEMVALAPPFADVALEVADIIRQATVVAGHCVFFDRGMIAAELRRHVEKPPNWPTLICTKRVWDIYEPKEKRDLQHAFKRFVREEGFEGAHGALADTMASLKVLRKQVKEFELVGKEWADIDPEASTWWGSSNHIVWRDGMLFVNFGKHEGTPVHQVDRGYWSWLVRQDFPEHVVRLADFIMMVSRDPDRIATWAKGEIL